MLLKHPKIPNAKIKILIMYSPGHHSGINNAAENESEVIMLVYCVFNDTNATLVSHIHPTCDIGIIAIKLIIDDCQTNMLYSDD